MKMCALTGDELVCVGRKWSQVVVQVSGTYFV
jgi:hypothetical protein